MKNKETLSFLFITCFVFSNCWCQSQTTNKENLKQIDIENYLRTAKIVSVEKDQAAGRTAPWIITLDDGEIVRQGFFKHVNAPRPTMFLPDSYKYELAAYELNKLLDLNIVPPVVEREIEGIKGSVQQYIKNFIRESDRKRRNIEPPDPKNFENTLEEIKIFENLVYDECLDTDDIFIQTEDWKVWRVDFTEAFSPSSELLPGCKIRRCSKKLYKNLQKLDNDSIKAKLKLYLNDEEIKTLLIRKKIILDKIKQLIEEKGEESVLF